jgi:hypothetical protein
LARVTNQVYDGSEESYTDADGRIHYLGEFLRQTITDGYPLESADPSEVVRKSPRVLRPTEQGDGSAKQRPWRDCFKACCTQWDEMPDECPEIGPCPTITSKGNIWDAKQAQGVMCSYFDLFMGCCLSSCTEISVTGPGGVTYTGGVIPEDTNCWPCDSPCKDSVLSIAYTTKQMQINETQELRAHDSVFGDEVPCCPTGDLSWEIISGSGTLEPDSGQVVVYEAPATNVNCLENPTIQLTDCCGRTATLTLAVNAYADVEAGKTCCTVVLGGTSYHCRNIFSCDSSWNYIDDAPCIGCGIGGGYLGYNSCAFNTYPVLEDTRGDAKIAAGCCPWQLI